MRLRVISFACKAPRAFRTAKHGIASSPINKGTYNNRGTMMIPPPIPSNPEKKPPINPRAKRTNSNKVVILNPRLLTYFQLI